MRNRRPLRAMWLLNHTTARAFEVTALKQAGVAEIFLPKSFPQEHNFRSADIDHSEDAHLTIPPEDLAVLNETDWYAPVPRDVWDIANRHFDLLFFVLHNLPAVESMARHFRGMALLRAYGLDETLSYSKLIANGSLSLSRALQSRGSGLMFAEAYQGLRAIEEPWLAKRAVFLPAGLADAGLEDHWTGSDARLFFVCPQIRSNSYYREIYDRFVEEFGDLPYLIGGGQTLPVPDPRVAGFVPRAEFDHRMREMRVMLYHSTEPRHVHYHPFEAIKAGMPLVYMKGGLLSRLAGRALPGEAGSIREAHRKIQRLLSGDDAFAARIRESQVALLEALSPERTEPFWRTGIQQALSQLPRVREQAEAHAVRYRRIAVILPVSYRGGSLQGAKLIAEALLQGSRAAGEEATIVFAHPDDSEVYSPADFADLSEPIAVRPFRWREIYKKRAEEALNLAGYEGTVLTAASYDAPDDGINNLLDCDVWVIVSDRMRRPILPMRPCIHMIFDYLQRYVDFLDGATRELFADVALRADRIMVTTDFTYGDAVNYIGIPKERVAKVPMLIPSFGTDVSTVPADATYFVWTTNQAPHKNHSAALEALALYYGELEGALECRVTGFGTDALFTSTRPHLQAAADVLAANPELRSRLRILGELPERAYRRTLAGAEFLWHPALVDNGTFSVIEAAALGVPSLSNDYPAMHEIDATFSLGLAFADARDPLRMAEALKRMEEVGSEVRAKLPGRERFERHGPATLGAAYWTEIREWL